MQNLPSYLSTPRRQETELCNLPRVRERTPRLLAEQEEEKGRCLRTQPRPQRSNGSRRWRLLAETPPRRLMEGDVESSKALQQCSVKL